jgi:adenosylcobinamide-GDP ribazoletransferase
MIRRFFSALAFLTVLPVPDILKSRSEDGMFAGYPAAGLVIGALLAAAAAGAAWLFPPAVSSVVLVGVSLLLTGAIHLDGLADCADAFYGRRDREKVLSILKDPRIGTLGGAAVCLSLLLRTVSFLSLPTGVLVLALPIASMFSRSAVLAAMRMLPYVRSESGIISASTAGGATARTRGTGLLLLAAASSLIAAVLLPVPVGAALIALALFWRLSWSRIGGCTGDVLGATIEIAEIVFFLALVAVMKAAVQWGCFFPLLHTLGL